ncbi:zinc-ribbon domain-containing protein [Paeniglutamicibacter sp. MACA_103]|uniref:zinc-ribbon domain-containing protein n=1 Tax=Paeniglutamicibacter sp. MACA_103 TaxID=3377337 RepID=UPI003895BC4C
MIRDFRGGGGFAKFNRNSHIHVLSLLRSNTNPLHGQRACQDGHEWESTVNNRSHGQGCPFCSEGRGSSAGNPATSTSLSTKHTDPSRSVSPTSAPTASTSSRLTSGLS